MKRLLIALSLVFVFAACSDDAEPTKDAAVEASVMDVAVETITDSGVTVEASADVSTADTGVADSSLPDTTNGE